MQAGAADAGPTPPAAWPGARDARRPTLRAVPAAPDNGTDGASPAPSAKIYAPRGTMTGMTSWEEALEDLVRTRTSALVSSAFLLTGDLAEAEDLVQDALIAAYTRRRGPDDVRSAEAYVRRTIRNTYIDGFRRRKRWATVRHLHEAPESQPPSDVATVDHVPARLDAQRALALLSPRERACVVLRFYEDMTVPQIASELSLSLGSVKRYLHDAVARLEQHLGPLADAHLDDLDDAAHGGAR